MQSSQSASEATGAAGSHGLAVPICPGHKLAAKRTISKTPANNGRAFYSCSFKAQSCDYFQWEDKLPGYRGDGVKPEPATVSASPKLVRTRSSTRSSSGAAVDSAVPVTEAVPTLPIASGSGSNQPAAEQPTASPSATPDPPKRATYAWNNARARLLEVKNARAALKVKTETTPSKDMSLSTNTATPEIQRAPSSPLTSPPAEAAESVLDNPSRTPTAGGQPSESIPVTQGQAGGETVQDASVRDILPPGASVTAAELTKRLKMVAKRMGSTFPDVLSHEALQRTADNLSLKLLPPTQAGVSSRQGPSNPVQGSSTSKRLADPQNADVGDVVADQHRDKRVRVEQSAGPSFQRSDGITQDPVRHDAHFPVDRTPPSAWRYLSEGGANVVLIYAGADPNFIGKALRIRKKSGMVSPEAQFTNDYWRDWLLPEVLESVQTGSRQYLPPTWRVNVRSEWIIQLDSLIWAKRPAARRSIAGGCLESSVESSLVVVTENLVGGTGQIAIEIKPKTSFVPEVHGLDPRFSSIKTSVCKYCLKRATQVPTTASRRCKYGFCPIDLYSRQYGPRSRALDYLTEAWKAGDAGNNMRVFVDGDLLDSKTTTSRASILGDYRDPAALANLLERAFKSSQILQILATTQRCFDLVDIQAVGIMAGQQNSIPPQPFSEDLKRPADVTEIRQLCQRRFRRDAAGKLGGIHTLERSGDLRSLSLGIALAAIVKDCSIILTWNLSDLGPACIPPKPMIRLVDLDLKPIANLNKWWKQDQDLCRFALSHSLDVPCGAGGTVSSTTTTFSFPRPSGVELAAMDDIKRLEIEAALQKSEAARQKSEAVRQKNEAVRQKNEAAQLRVRNSNVEKTLNMIRIRRQLDEVGYH